MRMTAIIIALGVMKQRCTATNNVYDIPYDS